jgi:lysophospholipase L1-like esterase
MPKKIAVNTLLFISACFFSLFVIELGLRFFWKTTVHPVKLQSIGTQSDGRKIHTLVPNDTYVNREGIRVRTNALGFRDIEHDVTNKSKDRIIFFGDSFTHATALNEEERLSSRIRQQLKNDFPGKYEVFNMGVSGNNIQQNLDLIKHFSPIIKPDVVVIAYVLNDVLIDDGHFSKVVGMPIGQELKESLNENLALYRFLNFSAGQLYKIFIEKNARLRTHHESRQKATISSYMDSSKNYKNLKRKFSTIRQLGLSGDFKILVINWPMFDDETDDDYPYTEAHEKIKELSEGNDFNYLDLFGTFYGLEGKTLWVSEEDHHPNSLANKLAFKTAYPALKSLLHSH